MENTFEIIITALNVVIMLVLLFYILFKDTGKKQPYVFIPEADIDLFNVDNHSTPYQFTIKNNTDELKTARLFGYNLFYNKKNFGSDEGIVVKTNYVEYSHLLAETNAYPFQNGKILMYTKDKNQFTKVWTYFSKRGTGNALSFPLMIPKIEKQQFDRVQPNLIEITNEFWIDGNSYFEIPVFPKGELTLTFSPQKRLRLANFLERVGMKGNFNPPQYDPTLDIYK